MIVDAFDATAANFDMLPTHGYHVGYTTGTSDIQWTSGMWARYPRAVRICQDAGATDKTADVVDIERGAATIADAVAWYPEALANFRNGTRPGQRWPACYASMNNITPLANAFIAAKITSGPCLFIADWNNDLASAIAELTHAGGPFPEIGRQFESREFYDCDVLSLAWLQRESAKPVTWQESALTQATALAVHARQLLETLLQAHQ